MDEKKRPTILITGGSGFLGGYLAKTAAPIMEVMATYWKHRPRFSNLHWLKLDLRDSNEIVSIIHTLRPDIIIHNAAMTKVDACENRQEQTRMVNIHASEILSRESKKLGARILYISTDLVFDGHSPPYSEMDIPNPLNYYGWSKYQAEQAVAAANPNHVIVRTAFMYGPPLLLGTSFSEWMLSSWQRGEPTRLFTDQYRTPIYAGNLARAILELAQNDFLGIIHLAGSERITRYRFGLYLAEQLQLPKDYLLPTRMSEIPLRGKHPADVSLNIALAQRLLHTKFFNCREGIKQAYGKVHP